MTDLAFPRLHEADGEYSIRFLWRGEDHSFPVSINGLANLNEDLTAAIARKVRQPTPVQYPSDDDSPRPPA